MIHEKYFKNITSTVFTRVSIDLVWWPTFWPKSVNKQNVEDRQRMMHDGRLQTEGDHNSSPWVYAQVSLKHNVVCYNFTWRFNPFMPSIT